METLTFAGILLAMFGGVLAFLSPCMLPVLPGLLAVLGISQPSDTDTPKRRMSLAFLFTLGLVIAFALLGAGVGFAAEAITPYLSVVQRLLGAVLILLGVFAIVLEMGWLTRIPGLTFLTREFGLKSRFENASRGWGLPVRALLIGAGFGLAWTPCIGPYLGAVMTYAVSTGNVTGSMFLFVAFGVGMGAMFLLAAFGTTRLFARMKNKTRLIALVSGIALILIGAMFLFSFTEIVARLAEQWLPDISEMFSGLL